MVEFRELESQDRFDWYRVNKLLHEVGVVSESHGLKSEDIVHLGGTAIFYRAYQAFGSIAVFHFRGTHDMDIVCFTQGSIQRILDTLKATPSSSVANYSLGKSASLPNKKSIYVNLEKGFDPGASTGFEIDVYESERGVIKFNRRFMTPERIVLDPPEELKLKTLSPHKTRGQVAVPSLRDTFIIKMDIMDSSVSGLRQKDKVDILTLLAVCKQLDCSFDDLLDGLMKTNKVESAEKKLLALDEIFRNPVGVNKRLAHNPIMPSAETVKEALDSVKKYRTRLNI